MIKEFTVGADPEMFIINEATGEVVSSIGLIPGEKGDAYRSEDMPEGYGIETDNILAEFNIPPCRTKEEFIYAMNYMKDYIRKFVKNVNPELNIKCSASEMVGDDQLRSPEAKMFGCSVDFNAYTEDSNPKPCGESTNLRSAGCHIHLGYNPNSYESSIELLKLMDVFVGLPSILIDKDDRRRSLYGKAGCFRLTPYGIEYRVLSAKMYDTNDLMSLVWDGVMLAIAAHNNNFEYNAGAEMVIQAINESDEKLAKAVLEDVFGSIFKNFSAMADQAKSFITELETIKNKL